MISIQYSVVHFRPVNVRDAIPWLADWLAAAVSSAQQCLAIQ